MKLLPSLISFIILSFLCSTTSTAHVDLLDCLYSRTTSSAGHSNLIYTPNSNLYSSVLQSSIRNQRFNTTHSSRKHPIAIITPHTVSQIQSAVFCSRNHGGLRLRVRSGGHDFEGLSYVSSSEPFLLIDLIHFRNVTVDVPTNSAWVQAGAVLGEVYHAIASASPNLAFPAGICGGYGMLLRKYGTAADNILDAQLVDARGRVLDRAAMGEDVFWAIRGGGGNTYGIVVSWKLNLQRVADKLSDEILILLTINGANSTNRRTTTKEKVKAKSDYVETPLPLTALHGLWKSLYEIDMEQGTFFQVIPHGGRMSRISESSIPYPRRAGNMYKIQYYAGWSGEEKGIEERHLGWIRKLYKFMRPYVSKKPRGAYVNSRDLDLGMNNPGNYTSYKQAKVWGEKYYNGNFQRLARVKAAIDPTNFFRNEQSVPPLFHQ
ncbi:Berberine bridge enzyme-like Cyn d 4 [Linum grandiflorum]